jgi:uncharacterized membrane protein
VRIVTQELRIPTIESAQVVIILLFGLPLALLFTWLVLRLLLRLLRHAPAAAWIGVAGTLAAALSNNTLSSKTPVVMMMLVLVMAYNLNRPAAPRN